MIKKDKENEIKLNHQQQQIFNKEKEKMNIEEGHQTNTTTATNIINEETALKDNNINHDKRSLQTQYHNKGYRIIFNK